MPITVPTVTIAGKSLTVDGKVYPGNITVTALASPLFIEQTDTTFQDAQTSTFTSPVSVVDGSWSVVLPQQSATDPAPTWQITEPNGTAWYGLAPNVSGTIQLHDLKSPPYSWAMKPTGAAATIVTVIQAAMPSVVNIADAGVGTQKLGIDAAGRATTVVTDGTTASQKLAVDTAGHVGATISDGTTASQKLAVDGSGRLTARNAPQISSLLSLTGGNVGLTTAGYTGSAVSLDGQNGGATIGVTFTYSNGSAFADTCTIAFLGSIDGTNYFSVPFQQVDVSATPLPTMAATGFGGTASAYHAFQLNISALANLKIVLSACQENGVSANWAASTLAASVLTMPI